MAQMGAVALAYSLAEKQTELFRRVRREAAARAAERDGGGPAGRDGGAVREPVHSRAADEGATGGR